MYVSPLDWRHPYSLKPANLQLITIVALKAPKTNYFVLHFMSRSCWAFLGIPTSQSFSPNATSPLIFLKI